MKNETITFFQEKDFDCLSPFSELEPTETWKHNPPFIVSQMELFHDDMIVFSNEHYWDETINPKVWIFPDDIILVGVWKIKYKSLKN